MFCNVETCGAMRVAATKLELTGSNGPIALIRRFGRRDETRIP